VRPSPRPPTPTASTPSRAPAPAPAPARPATNNRAAHGNPHSISARSGAHRRARSLSPARPGGPQAGQLIPRFRPTVPLPPDAARPGCALPADPLVEAAHHADAAQVDVGLRRHQDGLAAADGVGPDDDLRCGEVGVTQIDPPAAEQCDRGQPARNIPPSPPL